MHTASIICIHTNRADYEQGWAWCMPMSMSHAHEPVCNPFAYACPCAIAILPQVREHVNSIEDVQAAPTQVLYSPSSYTQHQPRGSMRKAHVIMLPGGNWGMP